MDKKTILNFSFLFLLLFNGCKAQNQSNSLQLIATVPLSEVRGRIDHLSYNNGQQILYVAALGNNTIEVVDLKSKKIIHTIENLNEPQGVVYLPESNSIFVANGGNGVCEVFNATTFDKKTSIKLPDDADNVRYDPTDKKIYVGYGNGGIAIIDATTFNLIAKIQLSGHPESFQIDEAAKKMYVNVPGKKLVEIIDLNKNRVVDKWKVTKAKSNFPMSLDAVHHRLFIGCWHAPMLLILDTQTGNKISSLDIDRDVDDIFYSPQNEQLYLSCGAGYIDVFNQINADTYTTEGKISTGSGARTSLFIPELNQLMVASPSDFNSEASILIYMVK
ncbi:MULTISPECIES: YncE family protein [Flavobacteriaceae]|uniref:YVTN family beta-propeller protein n=3 Tax=Leeuwenhoekiella TaxID=283735 RepID=A0A4Q0PE40_9FLAO|nr:MULTISPECIES: YncE family protein [Flavobacteriaceae]RXG11777.1 hypothetical protein DSM02_4010 [Leeuwenhoekiella polynyae]RXG25073.1 hypothetical protein DSL99_3663 [Leeuwenhoekiella marinoflava]SHF89862.1 hypothetical protein SAMN02745246_03666 [Leeuwenhoekiella marinoflava DSM 3653]|tara:strand:+ start:278 stop:1273 length:996 start_codon:yes stop_codon:yes gene_type:complete